MALVIRDRFEHRHDACVVGSGHPEFFELAEQFEAYRQKEVQRPKSLSAEPLRQFTVDLGEYRDRIERFEIASLLRIDPF